jgi:hypothetical protein
MENLKITELRIGNTVMIYAIGQMVKITSLDESGLVEYLNIEDDVFEDSIIALVGVPVTDDYLVNIGFKKNEDFKIKEFTKGDMIIYTYNSVNKEVYYGTSVETKVRFRHELQNLYFALKKKELED